MGRLLWDVLLVWLATLCIFETSAKRYNKHCKKNLKPVSFDLQNAFCEQPEFVTFIQRTEEYMLLDNICTTYFPLPDDPDTFQVYVSWVFCDGSIKVMSYIATQMAPGVIKYGSPYCSYTETVFGNAGCDDTRLVYRCYEYGDCGSANGTLVYGLSPDMKHLGISCLDKVEQIIEGARLPVQDYYALPMKLPNKCVTQQACKIPSNPFYGHLPGHRRRK